MPTLPMTIPVHLYYLGILLNCVFTDKKWNFNLKPEKPYLGQIVYYFQPQILVHKSKTHVIYFLESVIKLYISNVRYSGVPSPTTCALKREQSSLW